MAQLIVNADDYGLSDGISRGILRAHREGIVTSTTALAVGPAISRAGAWLAEAPALGVGVHLAAVGEDPPLLSPREIPTLVDRQGRLPRSWRGFLLRASTGRVDAQDLRREFNAQIEAVQRFRPTITHLDSHQHLHLFPLVRDVVVSLAHERGLPALRLVRSSGRRWAGVGVNLLASSLAARAGAAGLRHPGDFAGFDEAGRWDERGLIEALERLAARREPCVEIGAHPGEESAEDHQRYPWGYHWAQELAALTSPVVRDRVTQLGFSLVSFAALS